MRAVYATILLAVALCAGCERQQQPAERWEELQFRIALRSSGYEPGDTINSGDFEQLFLVSLPILVGEGPGEAHAVKDNVWLHVAWGDLTVYEDLDQLGFEGFRTWVENRYTAPYGTSWRDNGWQKLGRMGISTEWDSSQTPVGIDASGNDPRIWCKMWRWAKNSPRPDIVLGEKLGREPADATDG